MFFTEMINCEIERLTSKIGQYGPERLGSSVRLIDIFKNPPEFDAILLLVGRAGDDLRIAPYELLLVDIVKYTVTLGPTLNWDHEAEPAITVGKDAFFSTVGGDYITSIDRVTNSVSVSQLFKASTFGISRISSPPIRRRSRQYISI